MDRRLTPATDRAALRGYGIARDVITDGMPMRVAASLVDLDRDPDGRRDRQLNFGADVTVIERRDARAFVRAAADGYCGWLPWSALTTQLPRITHRITAPASHVYPSASMKEREMTTLSIGARLAVEAVEGSFARLASGGYVPVQHIGQAPSDDPAAVAETLLGTPYLWGGNSRAGIDCSGLAQASFAACGLTIPGDSDLQHAAFPAVEDIRRNDLLFWPGHVAIALGPDRMIHATAFAMAVITEAIPDAIARIDAAGEGPFRGARRVAMDRALSFP